MLYIVGLTTIRSCIAISFVVVTRDTVFPRLEPAGYISFSFFKIVGIIVTAELNLLFSHESHSVKKR